MKVIQKEEFYVVGISVRTTNEKGNAKEAIPKLWKDFMELDMYNKVINRKEEAIYAVYTNYEKDHTKPYDTILGFKVNDLNTIPENMVGVTIKKSSYKQFIATGDLTKDIVIHKWMEIWNTDLDRAYSADFEVYDKIQDPKNGEVEIFIAIN